jgi:hypothetical protein
MTFGSVGMIFSLFMTWMWIGRIGGNSNFLYFQITIFHAMFFGFLFSLLQQLKIEIEQKKHMVNCKGIVMDLILSLGKSR